MQTTHLAKDYTDQAILTRHKERVEATLSDLGYEAEDTSAFKLTANKEALHVLQEQMRRDYCVQTAIMSNNQKVLKQLLDP